MPENVPASIRLGPPPATSSQGEKKNPSAMCDLPRGLNYGTSM